MNYKQISLNGYRLHIASDNISNLRLLQTRDSKYPLSQYFYDGKKPSAIINCSYFTSSYVIGRNQGDISQSTSSYSDKGWLGFALTDNGYVSGQLDWWDVEKSACGFTPATICIKDGENVEMFSKELCSSYSNKMNLATAVTFFGILEDKQTCLLVTGEKGLSGYAVLNHLKANYKLDFLCELDGGGSSEMIVEGTIKQKSTDGSERRMFNGLAFVQPTVKEEAIDIDIQYPCEEGGATQAFTSKHFGLDFGWVAKANCDIYSCADGEVVFEGYYPQVIDGVTYKPIGAIIKHNFSQLYDYYSIYWHLASTCISKGAKVVKGQKIGVRGNTGKSSGVHLHFQMLRLPKGTELPSYSVWSKYSFDPAPYMTCYDNIQSFKDGGSFEIKHVKSEVKQEPNNDNTEELEKQIDILNAELKESSKTISTLKDMNNSLDQANKKLQDKLDKIGGIVNE